MKICPFVSHLLGDDNSNAMTIDESRVARPSDSDTADVVILGYEDGSGATETDAEAHSAVDEIIGEDTMASHLYCLKETCRFYKSATAECQFDMIFSKVGESPAGDAKDVSGAVSQAVAKDIDKIWKFQTRSVTELVEAISDAEKKSARSFEDWQTNFSKKLPAAKDTSSINDLKKKIDSLQKKVDSRNDSIENLSTTMSDVVLNLNESITKLEKQSESTHKQLKALKSSLPSIDAIKKLIDTSFNDRSQEANIPDLTQPLRELENKIEASVKENSGVAGLEKKLDAALDAHRSIDKTMSSWQEEISNRVESLHGFQGQWEERFKSMNEQQGELATFLEANRKHQEEENVRQGKKDARKHNNLGVASFHNGALEMARDQFLKAIDVDPDFAEAYNNLGLTHTEMDNDDKASEAFRRAVKLNPSLHAAYNNLGYIFSKQGDYDRAIEMYNESIGRSTNNSAAYTNLGNAYFKLERIDDARKAWSRALELDPGNEKARKHLERIKESVE